jgi:hypothetical protein
MLRATPQRAQLKKNDRFSAVVCVASQIGVETHFEVVGFIVCIAVRVVRTLSAATITIREGNRLFLGLGRKGEKLLLTLGANAADELFPLGGGQFGHCILGKGAALPRGIGTIIDFDFMGCPTERADALDRKARHDNFSFSR